MTRCVEILLETGQFNRKETTTALPDNTIEISTCGLAMHVGGQVLTELLPTRIPFYPRSMPFGFSYLLLFRL